MRIKSVSAILVNSFPPDNTAPTPAILPPKRLLKRATRELVRVRATLAAPRAYR